MTEVNYFKGAFLILLKTHFDIKSTLIRKKSEGTDFGSLNSMATVGLDKWTTATNYIITFFMSS